MRTLGTWFHLRDGRRSFKPDPLIDKQQMFCHQDVQAEVQFAIDKAFATGETIKLLLWGDWGVGKTHTLRHLEYWLGDHPSEYPSRVVYVEIGDVAKNSRFGVVHKDLLDGIGLQSTIDMCFKYMRQGNDLVSDLEGIGIPVGIRQAFHKFFVAVPGQAPPDIAVAAWNFLRGADVGKTGVQLGLGGQITDSKEYYYVLAALGHLVGKVESRQLVFLVDEASKLEAVSDVLEVERHWVNVNKMIFDQENRFFGFVYTVSGKADELPRALFEPQIENRLGKRVYELKTLGPDDVKRFLMNLRDSFVDRSLLDADAGKDTRGSKGYSWESFPFTARALDRFVEYFQRTQENSKPRDIVQRLDDAAFYAMKADNRLVDEGTLDALGI